MIYGLTDWKYSFDKNPNRPFRAVDSSDDRKTQAFFARAFFELDGMDGHRQGFGPHSGNKTATVGFLSISSFNWALSSYYMERVKIINRVYDRFGTLQKQAVHSGPENLKKSRQINS